ncbi:MAG: YbaN family protein [Bacteroidota bacterium]
MPETKFKQINIVLKYLLFIAGSVSLILGIIGIFLPLLPTTPFLLLSAACYIRSSERVYKWLLANKYLGSFIRNYREKKGIHIKIKTSALFLLWATILFTSFFIIKILIISIILIIIAIAVTIHLLRIKTIYD